jgi:hypothetical protein
VWRKEAVEHFPNLRIKNYYSGGNLSTGTSRSTDLPTDSASMQALLDSYNLLDLRTSEVVILTTYPTFAARCLDTYVLIDDKEYPIKANNRILADLGITKKDIAAVNASISTGVVP